MKLLKIYQCFLKKKALLQYFIDFQLLKQENANSIPVKTL